MQQNDEPQLTPKTGLVVPTAPALSAAQHAVLAELYLPLIGPLAYSLSATLRSLQRPETSGASRRSHAELLGILNADLPAVLTARRKLEATGLLQSYYQQDELGATYIYQLQAPISAQQFFADDLLSVLLLDTVGEGRYQQLADDFTPASLDLTQAKNVTANLLDVFHIDSQKVTHVPVDVQTVRAKLATATPESQASQVLSDNNFDWQLLGQVLEQNYVDLKQVASSRQLIVTESRVYGISELEMAKLISEVASLTTGQFDEKQLKLLIARRYERAVATAPTSAAAQPATSKPEKSVAQGSLSSAEQQLVAYAKATSPYDFLAELKDEKHGFVTAGEGRLVRDLISRGTLPNAVVNIVIYYLLQNRELSTLNSNLLGTVANDWQQHGINTPETALAYLKERQKPKPRSNRRNNNGRPTRKEIVPKWAQKQAGESGQPVKSKAAANQLTEAQRKQLAERVAKLASTDKNDQKGD